MRVNPYLVFRGNAEEALNYYNSILNGDLEIMKYDQMPGDMEMPAEMKEKVMHGAIKQDGVELVMATDSMPGMGPQFTYGDSFFVCITEEDVARAKEVFAGLSQDGKVIMELKEQFWGDQFGMCVDKFGVYWMMNCWSNSC